MKLIRFGEPGNEKPGVQLPDGRRIDCSSFVDRYDELFFATGGLERLRDFVAKHADDCPVVDAGTRLGTPIARPSKIVCIGLNFADHAKETGRKPPEEPVIFFKSTSALVGPNDGLTLPRGGDQTDWEVELAVVIGQKASYVDESDALDYVVGYCLHNDYSERGFQTQRGGQWTKGKSCDTFSPLGPFLVTKDEIENVHSLNLWLTVNGEKKQNGSTADLIFNVPTLVSYLSQFMTLLPGDVISTGTPAGVARGGNPPKYLQPGDVVELGIDGLGTARQEVSSWAPY